MAIQELIEKLKNAELNRDIVKKQYEDEKNNLTNNQILIDNQYNEYLATQKQCKQLLEGFIETVINANYNPINVFNKIHRPTTRKEVPICIADSIPKKVDIGWDDLDENEDDNSSILFYLDEQYTSIPMDFSYYYGEVSANTPENKNDDKFYQKLPLNPKTFSQKLEEVKQGFMSFTDMLYEEFINLLINEYNETYERYEKEENLFLIKLSDMEDKQYYVNSKQGISNLQGIVMRDFDISKEDFKQYISGLGDEHKKQPKISDYIQFKKDSNEFYKGVQHEKSDSRSIINDYVNEINRLNKDMCEKLDFLTKQLDLYNINYENWMDTLRFGKIKDTIEKEIIPVIRQTFDDMRIYLQYSERDSYVSSKSITENVFNRIYDESISNIIKDKALKMSLNVIYGVNPDTRVKDNPTLQYDYSIFVDGKQHKFPLAVCSYDDMGEIKIDSPLSKYEWSNKPNSESQVLFTFMKFPNLDEYLTPMVDNIKNYGFEMQQCLEINIQNDIWGANEQAKRYKDALDDLAGKNSYDNYDER